MQRIEHLLDAVVVGIDQRVVEDDGRRLAALGEQAREGQPRQDRELLAHAAAEDPNLLVQAVAPD